MADGSSDPSTDNRQVMSPTGPGQRVGSAEGPAGVRERGLPEGNTPFDIVAQRRREEPGGHSPRYNRGRHRSLLDELANAAETTAAMRTGEQGRGGDRMRQEDREDRADREYYEAKVRRLRMMSSEFKVETFNGKNIEIYKIQMRAKLNAVGLLPLVMGRDVYKRHWDVGLSELWDHLWGGGHGILVGSLGPEVLVRMKMVIETGSPVRLWNAVMAEYDGMPARNRITVEGELFQRKLKRDERMLDYINAMVTLESELRKAGSVMEEEKFAELLLYQTREVYPDLYNEFSRMKSLSEDNRVTLRQVKNRLMYVEEQARHDRGGPQREVQVNYVEHRPNIRQKTRHETLEEAIKRSWCKLCNEKGHWKRECSRNMDNGGDLNPNNFNGGRGNGGGRGGQGGRGGRGSRGGRGGQGGRYGGRGGRGRGRGGRGDRPSHYGVQQQGSGGGNYDDIPVLMVEMDQLEPAHAPDVIEWKLDSGSQANVCSVRDAFIELHTVESKNLVMMNGATSAVSQMGTVLFNVMNEFTGEIEGRKLLNVWYVPESRSNILAQDYFQSRQYKLMYRGKNQTTALVTKDDLRIKFVKINGLYRLWTHVQKT